MIIEYVHIRGSPKSSEQMVQKNYVVWSLIEFITGLTIKQNCKDYWKRESKNTTGHRNVIPGWDDDKCTYRHIFKLLLVRQYRLELLGDEISTDVSGRHVFHEWVEPVLRLGPPLTHGGRQTTHARRQHPATHLSQPLATPHTWWQCNYITLYIPPKQVSVSLNLRT